MMVRFSSLGRAADLAARRMVVVLTGLSVALLLTACSGSPPSAGSDGSPSAGESSTSGSSLAFAQCMRSHGVTKFPDPDASGALPKSNAQQLGVSSSQYQSAESTCQHLLPGGGAVLNDASATQCLSTGDCSPALRQQLMNGMLQFSKCMRSHGVPNFPDPTINSQGQPGINLVAVPGTNWSSSRIDDKLHECGQLLPNVRVGLARP
jgi:hypothetical protein